MTLFVPQNNYLCPIYMTVSGFLFVYTVYTEAEAHLLNTKIPELAAVVTEQPLASKLVHCKESLPNIDNCTLLILLP